jgi:carbon-monoxide dehydrogenase large subunit
VVPGSALRAVRDDIWGWGGIVSGKSIGARVLRTEDARLLTGRGEFVDDIHLPGMLHAAFVRASFAHARIRGVDASAALALSGVYAVLTWADLNRGLQTTPLPSLVPNPYAKFPRTQLALAKDEVCYVGEAVAIVVAKSRHLAEDAAALVAVDYEPLPAVSDCRDAVKDGAALAHADAPDNKAALFKVAYGDVEGAFRNAAHIFSEELWIHRGCGHALECRGVLADVGRDGLLTVWSSTQTPHLEKRVLADLLERNLDTIRVIAPDVGGGFGPKAICYGEDAIVSAAALRLQLPV